MFKYMLIRHPSTMENCKIFPMYDTVCVQTETPCAYRQTPCAYRQRKNNICVYGTGLLLTDKRRHLTNWDVWAMPYGRCRVGDAVWATGWLGDGTYGRCRLDDETFGRRDVWAMVHMGDGTFGRWDVWARRLGDF